MSSLIKILLLAFVGGLGLAIAFRSIGWDVNSVQFWLIGMPAALIWGVACPFIVDHLFPTKGE